MTNQYDTSVRLCHPKFAQGEDGGYRRGMTNPFRYIDSTPELIRLVAMMYVRYALSFRNVEELLTERGSISATRR